MIIIGCLLLVWIPLTYSGRLNQSYCHQRQRQQQQQELHFTSNQLTEPINPMHLQEYRNDIVQDYNDRHIHIERDDISTKKSNQENILMQEHSLCEDYSMQQENSSLKEDFPHQEEKFSSAHEHSSTVYEHSLSIHATNQ